MSDSKDLCIPVKCKFVTDDARIRLLEDAVVNGTIEPQKHLYLEAGETIKIEEPFVHNLKVLAHSLCLSSGSTITQSGRTCQLSGSDIIIDGRLLSPKDGALRIKWQISTYPYCSLGGRISDLAELRCTIVGRSQFIITKRTNLWTVNELNVIMGGNGTVMDVHTDMSIGVAHITCGKLIISNRISCESLKVQLTKGAQVVQLNATCQLGSLHIISSQKNATLQINSDQEIDRLQIEMKEGGTLTVLLGAQVKIRREILISSLLEAKVFIGVQDGAMLNSLSLDTKSITSFSISGNVMVNDVKIEQGDLNLDAGQFTVGSVSARVFSIQGGRCVVSHRLELNHLKLIDGDLSFDKDTQIKCGHIHLLKDVVCQSNLMIQATKIDIHSNLTAKQLQLQANALTIQEKCTVSCEGGTITCDYIDSHGTIESKDHLSINSWTLHNRGTICVSDKKGNIKAEGTLKTVSTFFINLWNIYCPDIFMNSIVTLLGWTRQLALVQALHIQIPTLPRWDQIVTFDIFKLLRILIDATKLLPGCSMISYISEALLSGYYFINTIEHFQWQVQSGQLLSDDRGLLTGYAMKNDFDNFFQHIQSYDAFQIPTDWMPSWNSHAIARATARTAAVMIAPRVQQISLYSKSTGVVVTGYYSERGFQADHRYQSVASVFHTADYQNQYTSGNLLAGQSIQRAPVLTVGGKNLTQQTQVNGDAPLLSIILLGERGVGKTSITNTLCGVDLFQERSTVTSTSTELPELRAEIIDTPGFDCTNNGWADQIDELITALSEVENGILAIVVVLGKDLTLQRSTIRLINKLLPKEFREYITVVRTHFPAFLDQKRRTEEREIMQNHKDLQHLGANIIHVNLPPEHEMGSDEARCCSRNIMMHHFLLRSMSKGRRPLRFDKSNLIEMLSDIN
ncbi:hypothetical protein PROFUN_13345 [Planoprotostelium fungivorum]|uniref:AIG1-type G domain-containing protein n=1 Tax=Planoprotostelium fungivorum TaxID=1890364 RepID=A0A2P6N4M3_9EUKA|nr:hypothetical protein PROFUN_13345 [Planoprotostelium fungivorum]